MTSMLGLPAVLIFALLSYMNIRSRRVSWIDVAVFVLFGFYLGGSGFAKFVNDVVSLVTHLVGGSS